MILAFLSVLVRWSNHSVGLTGWGWLALLLTLAAISDIGEITRRGRHDEGEK